MNLLQQFTRLKEKGFHIIPVNYYKEAVWGWHEDASLEKIKSLLPNLGYTAIWGSASGYKNLDFDVKNSVNKNLFNDFMNRLKGLDESLYNKIMSSACITKTASKGGRHIWWKTTDKEHSPESLAYEENEEYEHVKDKYKLIIESVSGRCCNVYTTEKKSINQVALWDACELSKDEEETLFSLAKSFTEKEAVEYVKKPVSSGLNGRELEILNFIVKEEVDITFGYTEWWTVGAAIGTLLGEEGREYFHDLSSQSVLYKQHKTNIQYNSCLRWCSRKDMSFGVIVNRAKDAGIEFPKFTPPIKKQDVSTKNPVTDASTPKQETNSEVEDRAKAWFFAMQDAKDEHARTIEELKESYFNNSKSFRNKNLLPATFHTFFNKLGIRADHVKDFAVLALLSGFSSFMSRYRFTYTTRVGSSVKPLNLYSFMVASQGSGKGKIEDISKIFFEVQLIKNEEYQAAKADYDKRKKEAERNKQDFAEEEPQKELFLVSGGSMTKAGLTTVLKSCDNPFLIETEASELIRSMMSTHGNFQGILRKGYYGEYISIIKAQESFQLENKLISMCLTSTPDQFNDFVTHAIDKDDGLLSRLLIKVHNKSNFGIDIDLQDMCNPKKQAGFNDLTELKELTGRMFQFFQQEDIVFQLDKETVPEIEKFHHRIYLKYKDFKFINRTEGVVYRFMEIAFRVAYILAAIRHFEAFQEADNTSTNVVSPSFSDLAVSFELAENCLEEALITWAYVKDTSSNTKVKEENSVKENLKTASKFDVVLEKLPKEFTTKDAVGIGLKEGYSSDKSVKSNFLVAAIKQQKIERIGRGQYIKL